MTAALHDIGHGAIPIPSKDSLGPIINDSVITSPETTEVNQILLLVAPDFPIRVANVVIIPPHQASGAIDF